MKVHKDGEFWNYFGSQVKYVRYEMKMNRSDFAKHCGISRDTLIKLEKGHARITLDTFLTITEKVGPFMFYILMQSFYRESLYEIIDFNFTRAANSIMGALFQGLIGDNATNGEEKYGDEELRFPSKKRQKKQNNDASDAEQQ